MSKQYSFDDFKIGERVTVTYRGGMRDITFSSTVERFDEGSPGERPSSVVFEGAHPEFFGREAVIPLTDIIEVKRG